ncbi:MAG: sensor domain-containing diguanylate cyclase [Candidatus Thiodiazotropha sp. (ex Dulcina madagascariensis)]|nr:sensor domain-containing diguanylate cyclase [Candidatus Thiodiazotropha sp. (ex Dulcina madagascariensis)]MCU7927689.1 sensor domain-containing diguanylate cyclase [Candidatus Thiodiazotropha sp. (ex Dulcina madagascariensis)]
MDLRERFFSLLDSLSALRALSQIDLDGVSEEELMAKALGELVRYQNVEHCSVFRMEGELLSCVVGVSMAESHAEITGTASGVKEIRQGMQFKPGEGIVGIAYATGQLQYCRDCSHSRDFRVNPHPGADLPGSLISAPIKMGEQVLGVLNASHPLPEYFEPWQQHTLSLFCSCLGQILYNHKLLNDLEFEVDQRTDELRQALQEAETLRKRYEQLSTVDELTGLNNRRYFFAEAEAVLSRALRHDQICSMMLIDVDYFKRINDQLGHLAGDEVLVAIARILKEEARGGDIVARVGGEEFVVLLPEVGLEGANLMAQRIQERLAQLEAGRDLAGLNLTASVGMTVLTPDYDRELSATELLDLLYSQADRAMYDCKREGRNCRKSYY